MVRVVDDVGDQCPSVIISVCVPESVECAFTSSVWNVSLICWMQFVMLRNEMMLHLVVIYISWYGF